jgi:hypothetical protein
MAIKFKTPRQQDEEEIRQSEAATQEQSRQAVQEDDTDIYGAAKDTSVFGEAAEGLEPAAVSGEIKQSAQDVSDAAKAGDTYVQDVFTGTEPDEGDGGGAAEEPDEPQGLFEDLGDIDTRQERERQAFADELEARRAEAMQQAQARAGLGGMGLSGATAELTADIGRQEARAGDIAMADLGRRQQQETFDDLRRQASIWAFEEEFGVDLDGDGEFGAGDQPVDEQPEGASALNEEAKKKNQENYDLYHGADTDIGLIAASNALGGIEAWAAANGAEEIARYRDENNVEWRVFRKGDGTIVKGTSQGLVGTTAGAIEGAVTGKGAQA